MQTTSCRGSDYTEESILTANDNQKSSLSMNGKSSQDCCTIKCITITWFAMFIILSAIIGVAIWFWMSSMAKMNIQMKEQNTLIINKLKKQMDQIRALQNVDEQENEIHHERMENESLATTNVYSHPFPFPVRPSSEMKYAQKTFKSSHSGLSPLLANVWGNFPPVKWQKLNGKLNWIEQWEGILQQRGAYYLYSPPLMLPFELYGWCIELMITWYEGLRIDGLITGAHLPKKDFPAQFIVYLTLNISIDGVSPFVIGQTFTLTSDWSTLWTATNTVDKKWPPPVLIVKVKK